MLRVDVNLDVTPDNQDDEIYAIIVHGIVPELMPQLAFRREKHFKTAGKKEVKCPYCRGLFKVVDVTDKLELICYPRKDKIQLHNSLPCGICHNRVGIIYASA